jgi:putative flippase GtrA
VSSSSAASASLVSATFVRYVAVGLLSLVVDAGTLWVLYELAHWQLWAATSAGFWLSFAVNFLVNKYFTFSSRTGGRQQLVRYGVAVVVNYLANLGIVTGLVGLGVPAVVAKVFAVALLSLVNFVVYKRWVFRD